MKQLLLWVFLISSVAFPVQAQESAEEIIQFGDTVTGDITNRQFEVAYRFTAQAGDFFTIQYEFEEPAIIILDENYEQWRAYDNEFGTSMRLVDKIPADGDYILILTRSGGRAGDSTGSFSLTLDYIPVITEGETLEATTNSETYQYYIYTGEAPFTVSYQRTGGSFAPVIRIALMDFIEDTWTVIAEVEGDNIDSFTITIDSEPTGRDIAYAIEFQPEPYEFYRTLNSLNYTLKVSSTPKSRP